MRTNSLAVAVLLALSTSAFATHDARAQAQAQAQAAATPATFIGAMEIRTAVEQNNTGAFSDSPLRVVAIEPRYNVGVAVVRRNKIDGRMLPDALSHDDVTEVYQIIEGEGTLITGGVLQSPKPMTAAAVIGEIGPSSAGQFIVGGTARRVAPGDIVIIPPHTAHGFVDIATSRIVYTIIRIDPHNVLELINTRH